MNLIHPYSLVGPFYLYAPDRRRTGVQTSDMAGIYLHIPFCKQACHYCNFHFSTSLRQKDDLVNALLAEIELQREYLKGAPLESVYFGGGTPSLLQPEELERIFEQITRFHHLLPGAEITLEANPDDLSREYLRALRKRTPVNRLSIGIQSFSDNDLQWMNRAHSAAHARASLDDALAAGFQDLTIDLIYGSPTTTDEQWAENLRIAFEYGLPHLSCYGLTVEEKTALGTWVRKGLEPPVDEEKSARQFEYLMEQAAAHGYEHYEISNFAMPGRYARHNSNYWFGVPYLGLGPAAHSFDGASRQWNIANNSLYIKSLKENRVPFELEILDQTQRYNEYVMTSLRTMWGIDPEKLNAFGPDFHSHFLKAAAPYIQSGALEKHEGKFRISNAGKLMADRIAMELFR